MAHVNNHAPVRSNGRILTTHAGSLPRPRKLIESYARREQGEPVDKDLLFAQVTEATRNAVAQQHSVGIDIANNGEQAREAFFLYVRGRMSGFGDRTARKPWGDLLAYPEFAEASGLAFASRPMVSNRNPSAVSVRFGISGRKRTSRRLRISSRQ